MTGSNVTENTAPGLSARKVSTGCVQWLAVRNTCGAISVPEHHWKTPSPGMLTTIDPTNGCEVPSGTPKVMAAAGVAAAISRRPAVRRNERRETCDRVMIPPCASSRSVLDREWLVDVRQGSRACRFCQADASATIVKAWACAGLALLNAFSPHWRDGGSEPLRCDCRCQWGTGWPGHAPNLHACAGTAPFARTGNRWNAWVTGSAPLLLETGMKLGRNTILAAAMLACVPALAQTDAPSTPRNTTVFKCTGADGSVIFSESPCSPDPSKVQEVDTSRALLTGSG